MADDSRTRIPSAVVGVIAGGLKKRADLVASAAADPAGGTRGPAETARGALAPDPARKWQLAIHPISRTLVRYDLWDQNAAGWVVCYEYVIDAATYTPGACGVRVYHPDPGGMPGSLSLDLLAVMLADPPPALIPLDIARLLEGISVLPPPGSTSE